MRPALACLLLLTACSAEPRVASDPPAAPAPAAPTQSHAAAPAGAPVTTLTGEWRIAAIDGKDFDEPYGLALSADAKEIWWAPRCAGLVRIYTISGGSFRSGPAIGIKLRAPGEPTPPVCAIGLPPRIDEVTGALDAATAIRRTPANGIELSGGGRSLLLFSQ